MTQRIIRCIVKLPSRDYIHFQTRCRIFSPIRLSVRPSFGDISLENLEQETMNKAWNNKKTWNSVWNNKMEQENLEQHISGVPQGSVLGPILFLIFINDLPDKIKSSVRLFADDCVLYRNIHSLQDCLILQKDLDSLGLWEADWQMKFKVAKCHSMRVTRHYSHKQIIHDYTLHQQTLENVQSAKYLGITITENMDWGQHISDISSKATKTLGFLRRNLAFAPRSTKEVAYKTLVRPKLEYAAPIWSPYCKTQIQQVEKVQRTAARWTCRRWRNTSSVGEMLDELQWPTLEARRDQSSLLFFHKIHCGTMSIDKDKYLTPSQSTRSTRSSHNSQYCRPQTYSDALKYSFSPRTIPHWNSLAPSVVAAETTEEFRALI